MNSYNKKLYLLIYLSLTLAVGQLFANKELICAEASSGDDKDTSVNTSDKFPKIFFEEPDFDFKKIYRGEKVDHIYKFENKGEGVLEVSKVKSSCGCTAVILTYKTVPPGKTGEIKATFNSGSYNGKVKKSITVISNDPDSPEYKLTISGEIVEDISITPRNVNFGSIYLGKRANETVTIKSEAGTGFKIKEIKPSKPIVDVSLKEEKNEEYVINISLKDDLEIGRFSGAIQLETDSPKQPKVNIPFFGEIVGDIATYPQRIYYGFISNGKEMTQKLFVKVNKEGTKISDIKVSPDYVSAKIVEKSEQINPHYLIEVKVSKEADIGQLKGELELYTNSEIQPVVKVPIVGNVNTDNSLPLKTLKFERKTPKDVEAASKAFEKLLLEAAEKKKGK